jgi:hypothetical protein
MFQTVAPEAYMVIRPIFTTIYLMWAFLWMRVAGYYGLAAYASWISNNGRWRFVLSDILQPFWWAFKQTLCRWRLFKGAQFCGTEIPSPYESGHLLRFSIFVGTWTPFTFGLQFAELNRSTWTYFQLCFTIIFASTSIIAAGGHLFLAFRSRPEAWRKLVVRCTLWLLFTPSFFYFWYQNVASNIMPWHLF